MGSASVEPSAMVGRMLRQKRIEFGLSLASVSERLAERGHRVPPSTLGRIEQGKLDPGVRRLHLLLGLYQVPPHLVSDLVELESLAGDAPIVVPGDDLQALHDEGVSHWKHGDVARGLAYLMAVRRYAPRTADARELRQRTTLAFATAARNLGKYGLAKQIVDEILCEDPLASVKVPALVLASSLWRGLGSRDVALALIERAEALVGADSLQQRAWVLHQKAKLLLGERELGGATDALDRAIAIFRELGDTYGEVRALVLRVELDEARGERSTALETAREVLRLSEAHGHDRIRSFGHIELGRLLAANREWQPALEHLSQGLGEAVRGMDMNAQFFAHYHLWKAFKAMSNPDRAAVELQAARYFVRFVDERTAETDEILNMNRGEAP